MFGRSIYLKRIPLTLLLAFIALSEVCSAQYMEFEWSDEFRYTNRKTGFFTEFIGTSQTSIYLLQRNISKSNPYDDAKLMVVSLNRNTLTEDTLLHLKGFPENEAQAAKLASLDFVKSVVVDGRLLVFWRKLINTDSTRTEEIYGQAFKSDLKPATKILKLFVYKHEVEDRASVFDPPMCVVLTDPDSDDFVIGTERYADDQVEFYYGTFSAGLATNKTGVVPLPQKVSTFPEELTSTYDLKKNMLCIRSKVDFTEDERISFLPKHVTDFHAFTLAKVNSDKSTSIELRGADKTITDFSYQLTGEKTRVLGFFGDLAKDTSGIDNQGLFYADIDNATMSKTDLNFTYFERSTFNRLFPKKRMKKLAKEGLSEEELLESRFDIEYIESMPDNSLILFFTQEYNYTGTFTRSDLNGENVYSSESTQKKRDVFSLRFSEAGEVMWARSLERKITYQGEDIPDIRVVYKYDKFIVLYGNEDAEMKPPKPRKRFKHLTEELEYATFDPNSGRAKTFTTEVNEPKTDKRDKRYLDPNSAIVVDGQFYFHKMKIRQNPLWTAANVVCFPTIYYSVLTGNTKVGKADFTLMRVMEGKRPRRKR